MTPQEFLKIGKIVENHFGNELVEYRDMTSNIFKLDKEETHQIILGFLTTSLCNGKIMLKKEIDYGTREC